MRSGSEPEAEYRSCLDATQRLLFRRGVTCVIERLSIRTKVACHDNSKALGDQGPYTSVHMRGAVALDGHGAGTWSRLQLLGSPTPAQVEP